MQKTDFPFEAIVHDDCSTDGSASIIKEYADKYPTIIKPIFEKENQYSKIGFSGINNIMLNQSNGKYIASCEGDDYWTDQLKLQKQVDYLEAHPECGLLYSDYCVFHQKTQELESDMIKSGQRPRINSFEEHLIKAAYIAPPSWLFRIDSMAVEEYYNDPNFIDSSFAIALEFFKHSQVCYLEDTTCVYRVLDNSASHHVSKYKQFIYAKSIFEEQLFFCHKYSVNSSIIYRIKYKYYRKYYAQIFSYCGHKDCELLEDFFHVCEPKSLSTILLKHLITSPFLVPFLKIFCKKRYPLD